MSEYVITQTVISEELIWDPFLPWGMLVPTDPKDVWVVSGPSVAPGKGVFYSAKDAEGFKEYVERYDELIKQQNG